MSDFDSANAAMSAHTCRSKASISAPTPPSITDIPGRPWSTITSSNLACRLVSFIVIAAIAGCGAGHPPDRAGLAETYVHQRVTHDVMRAPSTRLAARGDPDVEVLCGSAQSTDGSYDCDATFYATFNRAEAGRERWRVRVDRGHVTSARRVESNIGH